MSKIRIEDLLSEEGVVPPQQNQQGDDETTLAEDDGEEVIITIVTISGKSAAAVRSAQRLMMRLNFPYTVSPMGVVCRNVSEALKTDGD